ncbi:hypothetical protein COU54_01175 [Candidatus Pacearchaeota archaeon CG10_big_fil_rev_8_21_14_0_10_31_24]|nr:MAG: hypothetical protein COU54_01175 [Candidatus Pacearchaeota archaeon CG10_big_fil_rev_8_21_14_0_10_31_24]
MPRGRYALLIIDKEDNIYDIYQTQLKECIPILESQAQLKCEKLKLKSPNKDYSYKIVDRNKTGESYA